MNIFLRNHNNEHIIPLNRLERAIQKQPAEFEKRSKNIVHVQAEAYEHIFKGKELEQIVIKDTNKNNSSRT